MNMPKFLVEVPHEAEPQACFLAVKLLLSTGSHYLTQADFGCYDGEHKGWITVEAENKEQARSMLPPVYCARAKIVQLNKFTMEEIDDLLKRHKE
jgi:hypothetical protein